MLLPAKIEALTRTESLTAGSEGTRNFFSQYKLKRAGHAPIDAVVFKAFGFHAFLGQLPLHHGSFVLFLPLKLDTTCRKTFHKITALAIHFDMIIDQEKDGLSEPRHRIRLLIFTRNDNECNFFRAFLNKWLPEIHHGWIFGEMAALFERGGEFSQFHSRSALIAAARDVEKDLSLPPHGFEHYPLSGFLETAEREKFAPLQLPENKAILDFAAEVYKNPEILNSVDFEFVNPTKAIAAKSK